MSFAYTQTQWVCLFSYNMLKRAVILLFAITSFAFAQQQDEQLAAQYMGNNEFDKAADLYERLYSKNPRSGYLYDNLLTCYFKLTRFDDAEKLVKRQQKRNEGNPYYIVDLGFVYEKSGQSEKAKKQYDEVIQKLRGTEELTLETANAFLKRGKVDEAIRTYQKARKQNGDNQQLFSIQLAQLYAEKHETGPMINEYMNALYTNPMLEDEVQGYLQLYLDNDADYALMKQALLKKVKDHPDNDVFSGMLVWLYVQRKDFDNAFVQAKAVDKRYKEDGRRLIDLAHLAMSNDRYDASATIFNYVATLGKDAPYYVNARMGSLEAKHRKIFYLGNYTQADLLALQHDYEVFIQEMGRYYFTAPTIRNLARLQAYYLGDYAHAILNFEELIAMPRVDNKFRAECKLELGDIYVLKGEEWEAMLLYGQVDKDFLEDPLGQEAKFRNAKLSYYLGEFEWARAQLDVLKTATTQLIANNALELSLVIQDNTVDSNEEPLHLFARADLYYFQNKLADASMLLDSINTMYPKHALDDDIIYKRAEIAMKQKDYSKAAGLFEQVVKEHGTGILGDNALFMLADLNESKLNNKAEAMKLYEQFIEKYPGSFFLTEVRKRYRALRGDAVN